MNPQQLFAAVVLQLGALALVLQGGNSVAMYVGFISSHASASALFVLTLYPLLPANFRRPRTTVLALCFGLAFFLPFFGLVALLLAIVVMRLAPQRDPVLPFGLAASPEFLLSVRPPVRRFRELSARALLADTGLAPTLRARALNVLSTLPVRVVGSMLQQLLADPVEDLRLLAYGLLDNREKALRERIAAQTAALEAAADAPALIRARLLRSLVELNFELVYQGLVQGDLRAHALAETLQCAEQALVLDPTDAGVWQLRARVHLETGHSELASIDLRHAAECGAAPSRVLPYLAEISFRAGDWASVRETLGQLQSLSMTPRVAALMRYWRTEGDRR